MKAELPTFAGNKQISVLFFHHRLRLFHLSTEKVQAFCVGTGHQSVYSCAHTIKSSTNTDQSIFHKRKMFINTSNINKVKLKK